MLFTKLGGAQSGTTKHKSIQWQREGFDQQTEKKLNAGVRFICVFSSYFSDTPAVKELKAIINSALSEQVQQVLDRSCD